MRLLELFDKTVPYEWTSQMGMPQAVFNIDDREYTVWFVPYEGSFGAYSDAEVVHQHDDVWMGAMQMSSEGGEYQDENYLTQTGNEFLVFSTVLTIFGEFLQKHQPEVFAVASLMEERRHEVYSKIQGRMVKRIQRLGYEPIEEETLPQTPFGPVHVFYLLRQDLT